MNGPEPDLEHSILTLAQNQPKTLILFLGRRNILTYQVFFSWQAAYFYHTVVSRWYCTHKNRMVWRHNDVINNDLCLSTPLRTIFVRQSMKNRSHFFINCSISWPPIIFFIFFWKRDEIVMVIFNLYGYFFARIRLDQVDLESDTFIDKTYSQNVHCYKNITWQGETDPSIVRVPSTKTYWYILRMGFTLPNDI